MASNTPADMTGDDFSWAAQLMQRRREIYAQYSPVFWRAAQGVQAAHAQFLTSCAAREGAVALRTQHGFIVSCPQSGRCFVDDFAVEDDSLWVSEGKDLLLAAWQVARSTDQNALRVVTARRDLPKRQMLIDLGLTANCRWWVKELTPTCKAQPYGRIKLLDVEALLVPAPPVYEPGGPVCLLGDLDGASAGDAGARAAAAGAVLAIVQRDGGDLPVPAVEPALEAAGYQNPSEFYQGRSCSMRT